jgi:hypothetical protein
MPTGVPNPSSAPTTSGKAKVSLVFGILAVLCVPLNFLPALIGLILGILGVRDIGKSGGAVGGKGLAVTGIILSCLGFLCGCVSIGVGIPAGFKVFETRDRVRSTQNLKVLALAAHNYASTYQDKLPGAIADPQNKPLLSVRVQLLPYMEHDPLFKSFDKQQAWDAPGNKALLAARPKFYEDPANPTLPDATTYRFFVGPGTLFSEPGYKSPYTIANIPDGTSNTILTVGATDGVPWSKPEELTYAPGIVNKLGPPGKDYFIVAMADGSTRFIKKTISEATLKNAIDPKDGMVLGPDF